MKRLTVYQRAVLILGAVFISVCVARSADHRPLSPGWQVRTQRSDPAVTRAEDAGAYPDSLLEGEIIDLNAASRSDLLRLPDVGAVRADAILAYRDGHGPFQTVDDLLNVFGIGPATLEQLRPYVRAG